MSAFDPKILSESLPADVHGIVNQVTANVNVAVDDLIKKFKASADQAVADFDNKKFPDQVKVEIDRLNENYQAELGKFDADIAAMQKAVQTLAAMPGVVADPQLAAAVRALNDSNTALSTRLTSLKNNVTAVGEKSGAAIGKAAYKFFTGGIV